NRSGKIGCPAPYSLLARYGPAWFCIIDLIGLHHLGVAGWVGAGDDPLKRRRSVLPDRIIQPGLFWIIRAPGAQKFMVDRAQPLDDTGSVHARLRRRFDDVPLPFLRKLRD